MRTVESGLRKYYRQSTNEDSGTMGWTQILQALEKEPSCDRGLLKYFDYLREIRNPLAHPEIRCTRNEAEQIFSHAVHIFTRIHS